MFDFISVIFRHTFWLVIIVLFLIVGGIISLFDGCSSSCSRDDFKSEVGDLIEDGETVELAEVMHEHFLDDCNADTNYVSAKEGYIAEKAIDKCIEKKDIESAKMIYRDYKYGLSDYKRPMLFEYLKKTGSADSLLYTPERYGYQY